MTKLHLAACAMLVAAAPALSTSGSAAPAFPHAIAAGALQDQFRLVQYGGGDDDTPRGGGGGGYSRGGGGGYSQPRGNGGYSGGGGGGAVLEGLIKGGMEIYRQNQRQQQMQQQQQQYRQQQHNRDLQDARRRDRIRQQQQDEAKQRERNRELDRIRKQQAEKDQARQEELKQLKEQNAQYEKKKRQEDAIQQEDDAQKQRNAAHGNEPNNSTEEDVVPDKLENNNVTIKVTIYPADDRPPPDDIPPLVVNKNTQLPACGYVNLPADRDLCSGRTASGGWLRVVSVPTTNGGRRSVCLSYCTTRPIVKQRVVVVPAKPVPPAPYVEPPPKRPLTPAVYTVKAGDYVEPPPKRPLTPAVYTVKAGDYVEPERKRQLTPAVYTVKAGPYVEPEPKRTLTPAVSTVKAGPYVEPEPKRTLTLTPAVSTVKAGPYTEPEPKRELTPAVETVKAGPYTEPESKRPVLTPAVYTAKAQSHVEPESPDFGFDSVTPKDSFDPLREFQPLAYIPRRVQPKAPHREWTIACLKNCKAKIVDPIFADCVKQFGGDRDGVMLCRPVNGFLDVKNKCESWCFSPQIYTDCEDHKCPWPDNKRPADAPHWAHDKSDNELQTSDLYRDDKGEIHERPACALRLFKVSNARWECR